MKKMLGIKMILMMLVFSLGILSAAWAELMPAGNKVCPVGGEAVDSMGGPFQIEHNGKLYNLCCEMCAKDFLKDPEKYSAIAESEE